MITSSVHVPRALPLDALMKKMALDKKNRGTTIRCTIVTDIGVSLAQPQPSLGGVGGRRASQPVMDVYAAVARSARGGCCWMAAASAAAPS